jgi:hypothetical protein
MHTGLWKMGSGLGPMGASRNDKPEGARLEEDH